MSSPSSTVVNTDYVRPKIVLMGDSLTQTSFEGWGAELSNVYQRRADVLNRGFSGYNTEFYLRLPMEASQNVVLTLIFFGANDASLAEHNPHHHVSIPDYQKNLETLIARTKTVLKCDKILLVTPPPVHHEQRLAFQIQRFGEKATGILERTLENAGKYAKACQETAAANQLPCLDLYNTMLEVGDWGRFFYDGLHFSADGHKVVGKAVLEAIAEHYSDLAVIPDPITGQWANSGSKSIGFATTLGISLLQVFSSDEDKGKLEPTNSLYAMMASCSTK